MRERGRKTEGEKEESKGTEPIKIPESVADTQHFGFRALARARDTQMLFHVFVKKR